jgi:hypothetical protein
MIVLDRIRQFVERVAPLAVCEECLADHLADVPGEEVHLSVNELAVERGFDRARAPCALCGNERLVIEKSHARV